jgi:predicted N-formylglutamate amidohydrolase
MARPRPRPAVVIVTCEHGGNAIPRRWAALFRDSEDVLRTHRGYDIGAAVVAATLSRAIDAPLFVARTSRLLVDPNRSPNHPRRFSDITRALPDAERARIVREHYEPHRRAVEEAVADALRRAPRVVHLGVHSFTPVLNGVTRRADVGFLYDPAREGERSLCAAWRAAMKRAAPSCVVRQNYPYRGVSDGFTTALRRVHPASRYVGVEIEVNQARLGSRAGTREMGRLLVSSLEAVLSG